jgi:hypothetical protein
MDKKQQKLRTIKMSIYFWTNNLPKGADYKTAWNSGSIWIGGNKARGISSDNGAIFNDFDELLPKMKQLLKDSGIKLLKPGKPVEVDL